MTTTGWWSASASPGAAAPARPRSDRVAATLPNGLPDLLRDLDAIFEPHRRSLLAARGRALAAAHRGRPPEYRESPEAASDGWRIELPEWALDQRNQITGPADNPKLLISMCNSGDPGCMPDGEDSITTDWENVRAAQGNTIEAIKGTLSWTDPATGRRARVEPGSQVVYYRPRGLRLPETRAFPGREIAASLFDLAAVFHGTAAERRAAASEPALQRRLCFYLPKVESAEEAGWWSNLLAALEERIRVPVGTTKVMFLIESLPAAYQIEEILHASRRHVIGLNLGRWDYMASLLHYKLADPGWILPDRNTIPHDVAFFQNLRLRLVDVCHRRGALAIGGMTALFPDRKDAAINERAMQRLEADKRNEAALGFDGAWTGHPDQREVAVRQFPAPNQLQVTHPESPRRPDLTPAPAGVGRISLAGTRDAVRTVIEYRHGVLSGLGARMIKGYDHEGRLIGNFMEDLATDRIYRLMLAQRVRHHVRTLEGDVVTSDLLGRLFDEALETILEQHAAEPDREMTEEKYRRARALSEEMIHKQSF